MAALSTDNEKLAVMEWNNYSEPGLPLSPGALGQDDQQQLLWGMPVPAWAELEISAGGNNLPWWEWFDEPKKT